jgi:hypothetical protein
MNSIHWLAESSPHNLTITDSFGSRELGEIDWIYRELAGFLKSRNNHGAPATSDHGRLDSNEPINRSRRVRCENHALSEMDTSP